jgi:hypothetical protein
MIVCLPFIAPKCQTPLECKMNCLSSARNVRHARETISIVSTTFLFAHVGMPSCVEIIPSLKNLELTLRTISVVSTTFLFAHVGMPSPVEIIPSLKNLELTLKTISNVLTTFYSVTLACIGVKVNCYFSLPALHSSTADIHLPSILIETLN